MSAETIFPPIGGKKRGRPKKTDLRALAAAAGISLRLLERACFVRKYGVPELIAMCERGELKVAPAEFVARWPHQEQREACARGAKYLRELIPLVRAFDAEERQLAVGRRSNKRTRVAARQVFDSIGNRCPHCGGAL